MKRVQFESIENTFEVKGFEVINEKAMSEVRGGGTPRSRDKDIYEFEED
nr:hypothetical protein [uncultured Draconibacterium sp.]